MATVNVTVNGRPYKVGCEDGQEAHVESLARAFDRQVREVGDQVGQVGDLRLFLMAALVTADELAEVKLRLAQAQSGSGGLNLNGVRATAAPQVEQSVANAVNHAAERIEALLAQLD